MESNKKILLSPPHIGGNELQYIKSAFSTNSLSSIGKNIDYFENSLQIFLGQDKQVVALSSGTAAIHLALIMSGVDQGDEVLCQSMTFSASANPIVYVGATPIFIDSEQETWNMCPVLLEKAIQDRILKGKKPKAIIVVHLYGMPAKIEEICAVAKKFEITLIEDAAEALGSVYKGKKCGTFGDFGILSFNGNKIITTSGGGALVCKNENDKIRAIYLATQARDKAPYYLHSQIGYNYRMSNIIAGIGQGQMEVLDDRVIARRTNFIFYQEQFKEISDVISLLEEPFGFYANRWLSCMLAPSYEMREKIRITLEKENIESRPLWKPMHQQPVFEKYPSYVNLVTDDLFERGLCLPSGSNLIKDDLLRIVNCIKKLF